jgi:hypothetical protein
MLLYHWTMADRVERIQHEGFVATRYDAAGDGVFGVWASEDPTVWKNGNDTCLTLNVPDSVLHPGWRVTGDLALPGVQDWRLPPEVADAYVIW